MEVRNNSCTLSPDCSRHPDDAKRSHRMKPSDLRNTVTCYCNRLSHRGLVRWNYADTERIRFVGA